MAVEDSTVYTMISIHAPREGGDDNQYQYGGGGCISIHAPREGGDVDNPFGIVSVVIFQSTPPARGATAHPVQRKGRILISIHAPREGGDR